MKHLLLGAIATVMLTLTGCGSLDALILTDSVSVTFDYSCRNHKNVGTTVQIYIDSSFVGTTTYSPGRTTYWVVPTRLSHRVEVVTVSKRLATTTYTDAIEITCS